MDEVCKAVFEGALKACGGGGYAVVDAGELAGNAERELTPAEIDGAVKMLNREGYIDLKYARGNLYCLAVLKDSLPAEEAPEPSPTVVEVKQKFSLKCAALYCLCSFLGGAAGSAIACAIAAVI